MQREVFGDTFDLNTADATSLAPDAPIPGGAPPLRSTKHLLLLHMHATLQHCRQNVAEWQHLLCI